MREPKRTSTPRNARALGSKHSSRTADHVSRELMSLAVEAAHCRELSTFLSSFAKRAAELLQAEWGVLGEILGNRIELHLLNTATPSVPADRRWLEENILHRRSGLEFVTS